MVPLIFISAVVQISFYFDNETPVSTYRHEELASTPRPTRLISRVQSPEAIFLDYSFVHVQNGSHSVSPHEGGYQVTRNVHVRSPS